MELFYSYPWLYPAVIAVLGLIVGSFLNVVIHRLPIMMERQWQQDFSEAFPKYNVPAPEGNYDLSNPRSTCPHCNTQIRAIDNIPVLSWIFLRGKCHHCKASIKARYPMVELLTAVLSTAIALKFGMTPFGMALVVFTWVLIAATFIDLDTMLLPDSLTLPLMWAGIVLTLLGHSPVDLSSSVIGAVLGYMSLWSLYWVFKIMTKKEGMGYGDFKLLAALGAWLGWQALPLIVLMSSFVGLIFGVIQLRLKKQGIDKAFPFGPYLAIAGWAYVMFGEQIVTWYLSRFLGM
jgi:leader peptidase (prepilin peptidase)/N-methyltransferase